MIPGSRSRQRKQYSAPLQRTRPEVEIEVVAFGPGLHTLRDDMSPVKTRIESMSENIPGAHVFGMWEYPRQYGEG
jgi:hypothetical protein